MISHYKCTYSNNSGYCLIATLNIRQLLKWINIMIPWSSFFLPSINVYKQIKSKYKKRTMTPNLL